MDDQKPSLTLLQVAEDGPTLSDVLDLFRALTGREPTAQEVDEARKQLADFPPEEKNPTEPTHYKNHYKPL